MSHFIGVIIEESLKDKAALKKIKILKTKIEKVTREHHTPHLKQWTLHTIEIPEQQAQGIAEQLSASLDDSQINGHWYADFKNETHHYIIFPHKVFFIDRRNKGQYDQAKNYGLSLGIPAHQVDFHPDIKAWKR